MVMDDINVRKECWFTEEANGILSNFILNYIPFVYAFEFGSGSSTKYLLDNCDLLCSIEHDPDWAKQTGAKLCERPYNNQIESFEDEFFHLIIIDGRDRVKCIESSIPKLKNGCFLILDNSEREYYQKGIDLIKDWNRIDCKQNRPDKYGFTYPDWTTSFFRKPL
jgi:hypothetical protein